MAEDNNKREEREYFLSVISTFKSYREQSLLRLGRRENYLMTLPNYHKKWLSKYKKDLDKFKECIDKNFEFIPIVLAYAHTIFDDVYNVVDDGLSTIPPSNGVSPVKQQPARILSEGVEKVQSVFKQLMRDWSSLGAAERKQCYQPIIDEIIQQFPDDQFERTNINVLVPGAGLGRLAFEIASKGFACQGNEFNLFMLIVSYYVLNHCKNVDEFTVYPWIHQYTNNLCAEHQMTSVKFPDVKPMPTPESKFSMTAGDFLEVYTDDNQWHCVATCFFIDCAPNVVEFIETIFHILKPGGIWINLGPLLYHYSDMRNEKSVEPSFEVVCDIIKNVGFEMEQCKTGVKTKYCQNPKSMLQYEYDSVFFVCRKPILLANQNGTSNVEEIGKDL